MYISPLIINSLYGPFQPSFSRQTHTFKRISKLSIKVVFRLFFIVSIFLTQRSTYRRQTSLVAIQIASALLITDSNGVSILVIHKYAPKTKKVGIILFSLAKLLIAFTAIYKLISLLTYSSTSSSRMISQAYYNRVQYLSTFFILLWASIGTFLILIAINLIYYLNPVNKKSLFIL